jgi:hypothetical protein
MIPLILLLKDYCKNPIDRLYFQTPLRPLVGIRNSLVDLFFYKPHYSVDDFTGLWRVQKHFFDIKNEYDTLCKNKQKYYFHDLDPWFEYNQKYYYYKIHDFPKLYAFLKTIPCVDHAMIAVMEGSMSIPAHRAESNLQLRYHLTLEGTSNLTTEFDIHQHKSGEDVLFDHARYHSVDKTDEQTRVVLILDINRFYKFPCIK